MKQTLLFFAAFLIVAILVYNINMQDPATDVDDVTQLDASGFDQEKQVEDKPAAWHLSDPAPLDSNREPVNTPEVDVIVMTEVDAPEDPHSFYNISENSRFVHLDINYFQSLDVGDEFEITIPQSGITYPILVQKKESITSLDTLIQGQLPGYDKNSSIQITYSNTHMFISLNTPDGGYNIDAWGKLGIVRPESDNRYIDEPIVVN